MFPCAHEGCRWVRMGMGDYDWGFGHGKEAGQVTYGQFQSWEQRPNNQKSTKKQDLARRGKGDLQSHVCSMDTIIGAQGPIEQGRRGKGGKQGGNKPKRAQKKKQRRTCKHAHDNTSILHIKRSTQAKRKKGKRRTSGNNYPKPKANARQRQESKRSAKTAIQHGQKQSKKKSNENRGTVCVHKNATGKEKTQGEKQTTGKNHFQRKIIFA